MKLHTDLIGIQDVYTAAHNAGVYMEVCNPVGSRSRDHGFDIHLSGDSSYNSNGHDYKAATWDQWGMFMAALYVIDSEAMWGNKAYGYKDAEDFTFQTQGRFANITPVDTHRNHRWQYDHEASRPLSGVSIHQCKGCTASKAFRY